MDVTWVTHHGRKPCVTCGAGDGDEHEGFPHGHPDAEVTLEATCW